MDTNWAINPETLPENVKRDVLEYLDTGVLPPLMDRKDILKAYLLWNGIQGYTEDILTIIGMEV